MRQERRLQGVLRREEGRGARAADEVRLQLLEVRVLDGGGRGRRRRVRRAARRRSRRGGGRGRAVQARQGYGTEGACKQARIIYV